MIVFCLCGATHGINAGVGLFWGRDEDAWWLTAMTGSRACLTGKDRWSAEEIPRLVAGRLEANDKLRLLCAMSMEDCYVVDDRKQAQANVQGGGHEGLVKNLYTLYTNTGETEQAEVVISLYRDVLRCSGYSVKEIEEELELLWHS